MNIDIRLSLDKNVSKLLTIEEFEEATIENIIANLPYVDSAVVLRPDENTRKDHT